MLRTITTFCVIIFFTGQVFSQSIKREIEWSTESWAHSNLRDMGSEEISIRPYLKFQNNVSYPNNETMLPHYAEVVRIAYNLSDISQVIVTVQNTEYQPLTNEEIKILEGIDLKQFDKQENEFAIFRSRGESYLKFSIPTIRVNPSSKVLEKLVNFSIEVKPNPTSGYTKRNFATTDNSVLADGVWKMIRVDRTGIFKITFSELQSMGLTNLENISIWGHGGRQLPYWNNESSPDDLIQIPIWMEKGQDGVFNQDDYILFYAQGPVTWSILENDSIFSHSIHSFTDFIHYFITTSKPNLLRIPTVSEPSLPHNRISNSFDALVYFERNDTNLIKSGRQWFGESFDVLTTREYNTGLAQPVSDGKATIRVRTAARSATSSSYTLKANGITLGNIPHSAVNVNDQYTNFASLGLRTFQTPYVQGELKLELTYNRPSPAARGWLDYITVNARQSLRMTTGQFSFRDKESVGEVNLTRFSVDNVSSGVMIWDVTDLFNPINLEYNLQSSVAQFKRETSDLREFIAFSQNQAFTVGLVGDVQNQNIHGASQPGMVIVTHPNFLSQAQELAQIHLEDSGLNTLVVTNQQVYNEFSSGNPDVAAIRNMMRMFYNRAGSEVEMPRYLLLFGDGSYDNKSQRASNSNKVLTYQSVNSVHTVSSFVSDDFFGLLDENEGEATGLLDIGIGRIPSNTVEEANVAIRKIRQYLSASSLGGWHNTISFIGDDGDGNMHMDDANKLATFVEQNYPRYNIEKIYFDAFPMATTAQGARYPDVTNAINNRANQGALIMNYVGHANARWLAHEKVLMINDIQSWRNFERLPLFVTATCEFSRFDDFAYKSAGEHTLFTPRGGSVALLSTSRVVYANPNYTLNRNFFQFVFSKRPAGSSEKYYRLGDVIRLAKNATGGPSDINKRNFLLLGDPALQLHYPEVELSIAEINGTSVGGEIDTLKALSRVEIKGIVSGTRFDEDFFGEAEITLFDKSKEITTLSNRGNVPFKFTTRENTIYKGRSSVVNGEYSATFIIPKDIMYSYGNGRFSLFAHNGLFTGSGYFEDFTVGGISDNIGDDTQGPTIEIYMNDKKFVSGGITDQNPKLLVQLTDSSGINTTGVGIGHDLTAKITGEMEMNYVLNDYYSAELDSYQKGRVEYQLIDLKPGNYNVRVKAWDVYNNSSESEIDFTVKSDAGLWLSHVLNYPNPFTESTGFYFEHNQPFEDFDVSIQIFSPSGKLVKTLDYYFPGSGSYRVGPIHWDGLDDFGDRIGRGVYFYRLRVRMSNGKTAQVYQKLVILK